MSRNATIAINPDDALIQEPRDGVFRTPPDNPPEVGKADPTHDVDEERLRMRAYELWQQRGCPDGSPEEDWLRASEELKSGAN